MTDQELNKKLAEWAGWVKLKTAGWKDVMGELHFEPNFTLSLDACFKWLVPKLYNQGNTEIRFSYSSAEDSVVCEIWQGWPELKEKGCGHGYYWLKEEALALCKAIEQLIDKEEQDGKGNA